MKRPARTVSRMKHFGLTGSLRFLLLAICLLVAGCGGPSDRSVSSAPAEPLKAQFEVSAATGPFQVTLKVLKTELTQGESLWVQVVYKNVGTVPIIIAKEELEPPSRFFGHSVGMKFKLTVEGGDLSFMMGQAMDNHPPLDCMSQAELDKFFGKGPPAVPGYQVLPGEEIATRPYAYWRATDQYCKRTPPPVGKAPFSEIAQVGYLTPGRYVLEARLETVYRSDSGKLVHVETDLPQVGLTVHP